MAQQQLLWSLNSYNMKLDPLETQHSKFDNSRLWFDCLFMRDNGTYATSHSLPSCGLSANKCWTLQSQRTRKCKNNKSESARYSKHLRLKIMFLFLFLISTVLSSHPVVYMSRLMTNPTKWHVCPVKTQVSLGIQAVCSEFSLSAWRKLGSLATHWAHSEDWSDWADATAKTLIRLDAQADLSLRWAHSHFVGFVMRWLLCIMFGCYSTTLSLLLYDSVMVTLQHYHCFYKVYWLQY